MKTEKEVGKTPTPADRKQQFKDALLIVKTITETDFQIFPNAIFLNEELDPVNKIILLKLMNHVVPKNWGIFPEVNTLLQGLHISKRTLEGRLKDIKDMGYIDWDSGQKTGRSNYYQITPKLLFFHQFSQRFPLTEEVKLMMEGAQNLRTRGVRRICALEGAQNLRSIEDFNKKTFKSKTFREENFSNEKSPPRKKTEKIGEDMEEESPLSIPETSEFSKFLEILKNSNLSTFSISEISKILLGATHRGTSNVVPFKSTKDQTKGGKGMYQGKKRKDGQANESREDLTAGLALSKTSQTGRMPPVKGKAFGQHKKKKGVNRTVFQIEQHFKEVTLSGQKVMGDKAETFVLDMVESLGIDGAKNLITWVCDHWDELRSNSKLDFHTDTPRLDSLITPWSQRICLELMKKKPVLKSEVTFHKEKKVSL